MITFFIVYSKNVYCLHLIVYQFLIPFKRFKLLGVEVQRLHEETEENDGENPLRRWPTTKGEICNESNGIINFLTVKKALE